MTRTAEIVTFTLIPGSDPAAFAAVASRLDAWRACQPGCLVRCLSLAGDTWTDRVLWSDRTSADTAAAKLMTEPVAAPFMAIIAPGSVRSARGGVTLWRAT